MKREIRRANRQVIHLRPAFEDTHALRAWIVDAAPNSAKWLLSHTENGVVWGRIDLENMSSENEERVLTTADQVAPINSNDGPKYPVAAFSVETLLDCRVFGEDGELMLWRVADGWQARIYIDDVNSDDNVGSNSAPSTELSQAEYLDEPQILWGTQTGEMLNNGFTSVVDGNQGLCHVVPVDQIPFALPKEGVPNPMFRPLRLVVRHYLDQDAEGMLHIVGSRLVELKTKKKEQETS